MISVIIPPRNEEEYIASVVNFTKGKPHVIEIINALCMIKEAGLGIVFCSKNELLNHHADIILNEQSFIELLNLTK